MNRQAIVGAFTIFALVALFGLFFVLANVGTQGRYDIGVHFKSAAGLQKNALVYESGVVVGTVKSTQLLPDDFSVEVIMSINNGIDIPRTATFLIQAPLTGESTVEIVPPPVREAPKGFVGETPAPAAIAILPHQVLPLDQQPQGQNPVTVQDLLAQGQGEIQRLDRMLGLLQTREPKLLDTMQTALQNINDITVSSKATFADVSGRLESLTASLQTAVEKGSGNLNDITAQIDSTVRGNRGHIDSIVASLDNSARALNQTADSVRDLAGNPRVHDNLVRTTQGIADSATTLASIAADLKNVSGNPQTQAQLRDTVANIDAATQKLNGILAQFGGTSSVYGVDKGATPAPLSTPVHGGGGTSSGVPVTQASPAPGNIPENFKNKLGTLARSLVTLQVRINELSTYNATAFNSPTLPTGQGLNSDVNMILLPQGSTSLYAGANNIGTGPTTWNFAVMNAFSPKLRVGGGVLYSNLGVRAIYRDPLGHGLGFDSELYGLQHPSYDQLVTYGLSKQIELFGGERDILHSGRRSTFGMLLRY